MSNSKNINKQNNLGQKVQERRERARKTEEKELAEKIAKESKVKVVSEQEKFFKTELESFARDTVKKFKAVKLPKQKVFKTDTKLVFKKKSILEKVLLSGNIKVPQDTTKEVAQGWVIPFIAPNGQVNFALDINSVQGPSFRGSESHYYDYYAKLLLLTEEIQLLLVCRGFGRDSSIYKTIASSFMDNDSSYPLIIPNYDLLRFSYREGDILSFENPFEAFKWSYSHNGHEQDNFREDLIVGWRAAVENILQKYK